MSAYKKLEKHRMKLGRVGEALSVLHWDSSTMMPAGGSPGRSEQIAALRGIFHELKTEAWQGDALAEADGDTSLDAWQRANLEELKRGWLHATAVPADLVERISRKGSETEMVWRTARPANDFARLEPHLQEVLDLTREQALIKAEALGCSPYDALLDQYEPGGSSAKIDVIFDDLAEFLPGFLEAVLDRQASLPAAIALGGPFPVALQRELGVELMNTLGFDFNKGRFDVSLHPFCGGVQDDVRITTNYCETDFLRSLMGVLHETGHALYEMGLPLAWRYQPVGKARGMSIHESQSLLVEMQAGRSPEFVRYLAPLLREKFGKSGPAWESDNLYRHVTQVKRGLIRVSADEVTYPAHVILRYRLEKAMISGALSIKDLPEAWRAGMKELLGVDVPDDRDGCMQDIHWMDGSFGYFPTYSLGAMTAAQLFQSAEAHDSDVKPGLERGDFGPLMRWMGEHVHARASLVSTDELLKDATGSELDASYFKAHLEKRYLG